VRTTLDIADDVLNAAKELARREKKTAGQALSELARRGLQARIPSAPPTSRGAEEFCGFLPFGSRGGVVTNEIINGLREREGD
jgi:hypothetical protein